ncbi:hypothetical protein R3W88_034240 [Solanum pinnatisectum]|uniref:HECT-type E3 ubiquitin transferase n=1 Tax=Solanum pinnatisectum TaxID=50273 RepID=A0AAV9K0I3_9SOLN|nr:hypothetical protein R3W88_034240 [Solanum pinnatisectum]
MEQRLIYHGKQLALVPNIIRIRGTRNPYTWKLMSDLNLVIHDLCNWNDNTYINANFARMTKMSNDFLAMTPKDGADGSEEYLQIFIHSSVLCFGKTSYVYPSVTKKQAAHECICQFIDSCKTLFTNRNQYIGCLLLFCSKFIARCFPFVHELATRLSHALELSVQSTEFIRLSRVMCVSLLSSCIRIFCDLLENLELCLKKVEIQLGLANIERGEPIVGCWSPVTKLYKSLKEMFWEKMTQRRVVLCFLIGKLSKKSTDYQWILEHKELIGPGVLRGWFSLVCKPFSTLVMLYLFHAQMMRRFFPNLDPTCTRGCKKILETDNKMVDEDILGLTFFLCPNGKNTIVNRENRDNYVNLLVKHHFVTSIAHRVAHFAHGFDWKEHTNYSGYKRDDPQISWLWEGFGGLDSKLHIYQTLDSHDCLPSSHTCFYRLCFPPYPSIDVMQNRLNIITQTYVGCSFGAE